MDKLDFFTPVSYPAESRTCGRSFSEIFENYFYLGGHYAVVLQGKVDSPEGQPVELRVNTEHKLSTMVKSALKVLSYFTIVLPLIAIIVKLIFRTTHKFYIDNEAEAQKLVKSASNLELADPQPLTDRSESPSKSTIDLSLKEEDKKSQPSQSTNFDGKVITGSMKHEEVVYGTQEVRRFDGITVERAIAEAEKNYLLENSPEMTERIERCDQIIAASQNEKKDWIDSNYFRNLLSSNPEINSSDEKIALNAYKETLKSYITAPPNARIHEIEAGGNHYEIMRTGVVSDLSNGYTDLKELKEIIENEEKLQKLAAKKSALVKLIENDKKDICAAFTLKLIGKIEGSEKKAKTLGKKVKLLKAIIENKKTQPRHREIATFVLEYIQDIQFVENESVTLEKKRKELELFIEKNKGKPAIAASAAFALEQIQDMDAVRKTVSSRRQVLQHQMLQLVLHNMKQALKNPEKIADGSLWMAHVALLNRTTNAPHSTGWFHSEEHEMKDMAEIYQEFDRKKMILDGKGPYVDNEGNIHLPIPSQGVSSTLTLNTIFFNISVQGHTTNDGVQEKINKEGMKRLKDYYKGTLPESLKKNVFEELAQGNSSYKIAEEFLFELMQTNILCAAGCLSAKDRTGFLCARLAYCFAKKFFDSVAKLFEKDDHIRNKKEILNGFRKQVLKKKNPAALVAYDNTRSKILKINQFSLPGFRGRNMGTRLAYLTKQLRGIIITPGSDAAIGA